MLNGKICVLTGAFGFLGRHLWRKLEKEGAIVVPVGRHECDLTSELSTLILFDSILKAHGHIDYVFHLAAKVSGIGGIAKQPATFLRDNLRMAINVVDAVYIKTTGTHIIAAGSVCAYPGDARVPTHEVALWDGEPEGSNLAYGVAKRVLSTILQSYYRQYNLRSTYLMLANLYGPGDNYDPATSHAIPALIHKVYRAKVENTPVGVWGTGTPTRDFLYVEDAADAFVAAAEMSPGQGNVINIATGREIPIWKVVQDIALRMDVPLSRIHYEVMKPNGQRRRSFSTTRAQSLLQWQAKTSFEDGLQATIQAYLRTQGVLDSAPTTP